MYTRTYIYSAVDSSVYMNFVQLIWISCIEIVMMLANTRTHTHTCKSRDNFHVFIHPNLYYIRVSYVSWMASLPQKHRVNICFAKQNTWKHTCVTLNVRILYRYIMNISHMVIHLEWFKKKESILIWEHFAVEFIQP